MGEGTVYWNIFLRGCLSSFNTIAEVMFEIENKKHYQTTVDVFPLIEVTCWILYPHYENKFTKNIRPTDILPIFCKFSQIY